MKKYLTDSRFSVVAVLFVVTLVLFIQFSLGARIVYFLPDYPVTKSTNDFTISLEDESLGPYRGFEKCHFYGSCFNMANGANFRFVEPLLIVILGYYAFLSGLERTWGRRILGAFLLVVLYVIVASLQDLDWFFRCSEFCGIEYFALWIPLLLAFVFGLITALSLQRKAKKAGSIAGLE